MVIVANALADSTQPGQMDQSGTSTGAEGGDDDNTDIIEHPGILSEVMNRVDRVLETVNEMEDLMHNVIDRRIPDRNIPNRRIPDRRIPDRRIPNRRVDTRYVPFFKSCSK